MAHTDSERIREEHIRNVLRAGRNAAVRHGLQPADVDACAFDFGGHMSAPKRWDRWKDLAFSDAWLNACAGNYAINDLKKVSAIVAHEVQDAELAARLLVFVDPSADPECALMRKEDRRALNAAFARLTKRQRIAVSLRHYEDCAISEIARALNVTEGAAKNIIGRALVAMRGCLNRIAFDADGALNDFAAPPSRECSARSRTSDRQNPGD